MLSSNLADGVCDRRRSDPGDHRYPAACCLHHYLDDAMALFSVE
jgi:hypothetical protein